jgi:hypothetical protein
VDMIRQNNGNEMADQEAKCAMKSRSMTFLFLWRMNDIPMPRLNAYTRSSSSQHERAFTASSFMIEISIVLAFRFREGVKGRDR